MIGGVLYRVPKNPKNHQRGFSEVWGELLGQELNLNEDFTDTLYCDHGANFTGALNIMGGFARWFDDYKHRLDVFLAADKVYSLGRDMPEYGNMLSLRKDTAPLDEKFWKAVQQKCDSAETIHMWDIPGITKLAVGDSHTPSVSDIGSAVIKQDGQTLFSQSKRGFKWVDEQVDKFKNIELITLSFGNIDVRHHFLRNPDSWMAVYDKTLKYMERLQDRKGCKVELAVPFPVEYEGRNLPTTGYYKGNPFYGSRSERAQLVESIKNYLSYENTVLPPAEWYFMDPEQYAKEKMEQAGRTASVHLSPENYRRVDWGQPQNSLEIFFG